MNIDAQGSLYFGDLIPGDGEATAEEIAAWELARTPSPTAIIEAKKQVVRKIREQVLDRLAGIAGRASRKGDVSLAAACDVASEALLDITKDLPSEPEAVEMMLVSRYLTIRESATLAAPSLENAFAQVDA